MATLAGHLTQDQNINIHYEGASLVGKNGNSKAQKKRGGVGGRKALNDISNSAKPSALQASKKNSSASVISIGKDLDASRNKFSVGTKDNHSKGLEKGVRKALTDVTNSSKLSAQQVSKKALEKKFIAAALEANILTSIAEENFLHNHQKCIKAQRKAMDIDYFLKEVGLDINDVSVQLRASPFQLSSKSKQSSFQLDTPSMKNFVVEEMPELMICGKSGTSSGYSSPSAASPKSPKAPYMIWKDDSFPYFTLTETPTNQPKH